MTQHLQAGHLTVSLEREKLITKKLQEDGTLKEETNTDRIDFSKSTDENLFGIKDADRVVPGCQYNASLKLNNLGDVAIQYYIEIVIQKGNETEFLNQLQFTYVDTKTQTTKTSILSNGLQIGSKEEGLGQILKNESAEFQVQIEFVNQEGENNEAMNQEVEFDLIVHAVQISN